MLTPPIEPMLAKPLGAEIPVESAGVAYEPKWDGFRALAFRTEDGVILQGRGRGKSADQPYVDLAYAFPEVVERLGILPVGCVVDGEIVVAHSGRLDFELLTSRLRPRSEAGGPSIARLAQEIPATLLAFDLLADTEVVMDLAFRDRRARLHRLLGAHPDACALTPSTEDSDEARRWFTEFESAGVDGIMVKSLDGTYAPGKRSQGKVKHQRTIDVVLAGWREHTRPGPDGSPIVGSLLLGLHDDTGVLHYIGGASAFTTARRQELVQEVAELATDDHPWLVDSGARVPGGANRWRAARDWHPLRPERVLEISYDQREGDRLRHAASFLRWRPDREPDSCLLDQLETPPPSAIEDLLSP